MKEINIKRLRKSLNLTPLDFCNRFGISQYYLSEIENNKKPITVELYNNMKFEFGETVIKNSVKTVTILLRQKYKNKSVLQWL